MLAKCGCILTGPTGEDPGKDLGGEIGIGIWLELRAKPEADCGLRGRVGIVLEECEEPVRALLTGRAASLPAPFFLVSLNQQSFDSRAHLAQGPGLGLSTSPKSHFTFRSRHGSQAW